ncbi:hypothetical protein ACVSQB_01985 [Bradyrhizobium elkanii]
MQEHAEARATGRVLSGQIAAYSEKRMGLAKERHDLMTRPLERLTETDPKIITLDRDIAACIEAAARLQPRAEQYFATVASIDVLVRKLEDYFNQVKLVEVPMAKSVAPPKLSKNETLMDAIEARRRRVRELAANNEAYRAAPQPSSVVLQAEIDRINAAAELGAPNAIDAIESGASLEWPTLDIDEAVWGGHGRIKVKTPDVMSILSYLFREQMIAAATKAIADAADDAAALSDADRARLIGEVDRDALAVQREEVALIKEAKAVGVPVSYRPDTDPRALLGLADELPAPSDPDLHRRKKR